MKIELKRKSAHARNLREQEDLKPQIAREMVQQAKVNQSNATRLQKLVNKLKMKTLYNIDLAGKEHNSFMVRNSHALNYLNAHIEGRL